MNAFGDGIRKKREELEMLQRHLAAELDIDTALLSKIERGEKTAKRELLQPLANILNIDYKQLLSLWLADQVFQIVENEDEALQALRIVEEKIKNSIK